MLVYIHALTQNTPTFTVHEC